MTLAGRLNGPRRRSAPLAVFGLVMFGLAMSALPLAQPAGAQQLDSSGYSPCAPGQPIDLLVMMDASGSLHQRDGIDRDGDKRRTALREFRRRLSALVASLSSAEAPEIRVALWRFDATARQIVGFRRASAQHPSNEDIELSLGDSNGRGGFEVRGRHTDYLTALREAHRAFTEDGSGDVCRLLLFFTDGIYDPTGDPSLEQADGLRIEVCNDLKPLFESASIDTYAILLGDQFRDAGRTADPDDPDDGDVDEIGREMATASMQIVRALTGDSTSELTRGLPYSRQFGCAQWSDNQPADRDGSIIAIDALDRLAIQLLEVAEVAASGLTEWPACGATAAGGRQSAPLPAGRYIASIVAYPRANFITGYEIVADGSTRRGDGTGVEPLRLGAGDFGELDAGWTLEIETSGGRQDAGVACYIKPAAAEPAAPAQGVAEAGGQQVGPVQRSELGPDSPPLGIEVTAPAPPELCAAAAAAPFEWPDDERVASWSCGHDGTVSFTLQPLQCQASHDLETPLQAQVEPPLTGALFGSGEIAVDVRIDIDGPPSVLYDCLGAPALVCSGADVVVEPDSTEVPHSPLQAASGCVLVPPTQGSATVELAWVPDDAAVLPGDIGWRFDADVHSGGDRGTVSDDGSVLSVGNDSDAEGAELHLVSAQQLGNGDWDITGVLTLVPRWDPGASELQEGADRLMETQSVELRIGRSYGMRGAPALVCSGAGAAVEPDSAELPRSPLRVATGCVLMPPTEGSATVELAWTPEDAAALPGEIGWRFSADAHGSGGRGTVSDDGTVLTLGVDGDPGGVELHLMSAQELGNGDWDISGVLTLVPRWDPGAAELQESADRRMEGRSTELRIDRSYLARANSAAAFRLTLLIGLVSVIVSYVMFCLALVANMSLPDPMGYWMYRADLPVETGADGKPSLGARAGDALGAATGERIRGDASRGGRGKRLMAWESAGLRVGLRRAPRFWLPGLLRGAWAAVSTDPGERIAARPAARRRSRHGATAAAELPTLMVSGAPRRSVDGDLVAPAWVALPRRGRASHIADVEVRELEALMVQADGAPPSAGEADPDAPREREDAGDARAAPSRPPELPEPPDDARGARETPPPSSPPPSSSPPSAERPGDRPPGRDRPDRPPPRDRPDRPPPRRR